MYSHYVNQSTQIIIHSLWQNVWQTRESQMQEFLIFNCQSSSRAYWHAPKWNIIISSFEFRLNSAQAELLAAQGVHMAVQVVHFLGKMPFDWFWISKPKVICFWFQKTNCISFWFSLGFKKLNPFAFGSVWVLKN